MRAAPYYPLTATPFLRDGSYCEVAPCRALRPYIRCFWGTANLPQPGSPPQIGNPPQIGSPPQISSPPQVGSPPQPGNPPQIGSPPQPGISPQVGSPPQPGGPPAPAGPVIPDTCMDIIFQQDCRTGRVEGCFCGLDEYSHTASPAAPGARVTFAIRFYGWTAVLFAEDTLAGSKNQTFALERHFPRLCRELGPRLFETPQLADRVQLAQAYLLERMRPAQSSVTVQSAVAEILRAGGAARIPELARACTASPRQLERLFRAEMGCSPKTFASLVRYQCVWQDLVREPGLCVLDAVERYGYCDQAHLLNDFKKRHQCSPAQALARARAQKSRFFTIQQGGSCL